MSLVTSHKSHVTSLRAGYIKKILGFITLCLIVGFVITSFSSYAQVKYESRGKRDPFVPLIGVDRPAVTRLEDVTSISDIKLEGIAVKEKGKKAAILNGEMLKEGDKVGDVELKKIKNKSVTILVGGKPYDVNLSEEEGGVKSGKPSGKKI